MKIVTSSSGKQNIKISKQEWMTIGKIAGWDKTANDWLSESGDMDKVAEAERIIKQLVKEYSTVGDEASLTKRFTVNKGSNGVFVVIDKFDKTNNYTGDVFGALKAIKKILSNKRVQKAEPLPLP